MPPHRLLSHDLPTAVCTCIASPEEEEDELDRRQPQVARHQVRKLRRTRRIDPQPILVEDEDDVEGEDEGEEEEEEEDADEEDEEGMARQRHLYETAFDCKVNRSDDDLDDLDRVTNHAVLHSQVFISSRFKLYIIRISSFISNFKLIKSYCTIAEFSFTDLHRLTLFIYVFLSFF